jgi:Collagen triple helix repeat (20 copies)
VLDESDEVTSTSIVCHGATGIQGVAGAQGSKGDKGDKGDQGLPGSNGANGADGAPGLKGDKGDKGDTGATGATGAQGNQGDKGDKGDTGATGATGAQGNQGDKGDKGDQGLPGSVVSNIKACASPSKRTVVIKTTDSGFALYAVLDGSIGMQQLDLPDVTACMSSSQSACTNAGNIWTTYTDPTTHQSTTGCLAAYSTSANGSSKCSFWIDCHGNVVPGT